MPSLSHARRRAETLERRRPPGKDDRLVNGAWWRRLRPEEALLLVYAAALLAIMAATRTWRFSGFEHPRFFQGFALLAGLIYVRAYGRALRERGRRHAPREALRAAAGGVRDFVPFFVALVLYEMLHDLTPLVRPDVVDGRLAAADRALFGVDVAYWLGGLASPLLTRVMVHCYASYFVAPIALACLVYWADDRPLFRAYLVSLCLTTLVGYLGYLAVPAVGPYVYQAHLFPTRLPGGEKTHFFITHIDSLKGVARDCFPSLHTAHTTVVLAFAWRFRRLVFWLYLPVAMGLYFSTVYLRMHYVVDVAAGFAASALCIWAGPRLERWWRGPGLAPPG
jgi:membrane-associated phospholipid phosphatase